MASTGFQDSAKQCMRRGAHALGLRGKRSAAANYPLLWRREAAERLANVATSLHDYLEYVGLSHLPDRGLSSRWGHGNPPNAFLERTVAAHRSQYEAFVEVILTYRDDLIALPIDETNDQEPCWNNSWFPGVDTASLYATIRDLRPATYLEVGSGYSTRVAARAVRDGGMKTRIVSIDPSPRASIDDLCDRLVRTPAEQAPPDVWKDLRPGDVIFFDGSHHALAGSDVSVFLLEVLPGLPGGVRVGIHDVLLPDDYFPEWNKFLWSEQYVLAAYLLAGAPWLRPVFASYWSSVLSDVTEPLDSVFQRLEGLGKVDRRGWSFWFDLERKEQNS